MCRSDFPVCCHVVKDRRPTFFSFLRVTDRYICDRESLLPETDNSNGVPGPRRIPRTHDSTSRDTL